MLSPFLWAMEEFGGKGRNREYLGAGEQDESQERWAGRDLWGKQTGWEKDGKEEMNPLRSSKET